MTVAHFAECCELYELSGWGYGMGAVWMFEDGRSWVWDNPTSAVLACHEWVPAYDLGALAGYLPAFALNKRGNESYHAGWADHANRQVITADSRTNPANALCRLAIALFKAGVLMKGDA